MASTTTKKTKFEPIVIEIDGREVEICACGQTKNEDRTCDGTHKVLNAEIESDTNEEKKMTIEEVLEALNNQEGCCGGHNHSDNHECACGGQCGCSH